MGQMSVMSQAGDEVVTWDPASEEEVTKARAEWERLSGEGFEFYEVVDTKGKRVTTFDPKLGKVIAAPGARKAADKAAGTRTSAMAGGPNATPERSAV